MLLTHAEFEATADKIAKLNTRAAKKGWTGRVTLTGTKVTRKDIGVTGLPVVREFMDAEIQGTPPKYEGWEFLARAEFDQDSGLVVYGAPGACPVDRDSIRPDECDHCGIKRFRRHIYIVKGQDRQMQVGSTCIKDFLGWDIMPVWISADLASYAPEGGYGYLEPTYSTETVLAAAWAVIQQHGYVRSGEFNSTKGAVMGVLDPRTEEQRKLAKSVMHLIPDAMPMAQRIRAWVLSDEFSGESDYVANLKNIAGGDFLRFKNFGFLVSAPQAWAKAQERTLIKQQEQGDVLNEWNGTVGDKLELAVTLRSVRFIETFYGSSTLYTFLGDDRRLYKWFSSGAGIKAEVDDKLSIKGTIKKHDEYKGQKATMLTRVKVV